MKEVRPEVRRDFCRLPILRRLLSQDLLLRTFCRGHTTLLQESVIFNLVEPRGHPEKGTSLTCQAESLAGERLAWQLCVVKANFLDARQPPSCRLSVKYLFDFPLFWVPARKPLHPPGRQSGQK